jgi:hypothetical protein
MPSPLAPAPQPPLPHAPHNWQSPPVFNYADVEFTSEPNGLVFSRAIGMVLRYRPHLRYAHVYQQLCVAPCTLGLSPGLQEFALSEPGDFPRRTAPVTIPNGSSEVHGYFESRAGLRTAGWIVFGGSLVAGVALMLTAFHSEETCYQWGCQRTSEMHEGRFVAGAIILPVGGLIGIAMAGTRDVPHIVVR